MASDARCELIDRNCRHDSATREKKKRRGNLGIKRSKTDAFGRKGKEIIYYERERDE